jgi:hypothetical protein
MRRRRSGRPQRPVHMSQRRRLWVYGVSIGLWLSGALWLVFHYFLTREGEFGTTSHPLEPWWLRLHGAFAFAAIWTFGLLWGVHIVHGWSMRRHRRSGGLLVALLATLTLSGYLLYYAGDDELRSAVSVLHWAIGLGAPLLLLAHLGVKRRHRAAATKAGAPPPGQPALASPARVMAARNAAP